MHGTRKRRSALIGICVVALFFAGVTLVIAWWGKAGPDIPHASVGDRVACVSCHPVDRLPGGHRGRDADGCRSCHADGAPDAGVPVNGVSDEIAGAGTR